MLRVKTGCGACGASAPDDANFCPRCGVVLGEGRNPFRALIEATRLVAADAGRDLDATLDTLTEQARRLLGVSQPSDGKPSPCRSALCAAACGGGGR